jgi:protein-S-isoprenylcysteine O-methyltransferase Ste14
VVGFLDDSSGCYLRGLTGMSVIPFERHIIGYITGFAVFFLAFPYLLYRLALLFDLHILDHWSRHIIAILLLIPGLILAIWSNIVLVTRGKGGPADIFNVAISPRTQQLVVTGPYQYTRNPMVFGVFCCYFGLAVFLNSLPDLIILTVLFIAARFYLEETEERRLWKDFGKEYEEYRKRVPMIVPRMFGRK